MRVAVDTNVLLDQAKKDGAVLDALAVIRRRSPDVEFVVTETVIGELAWAVEKEPETEKGRWALTALRCLQTWEYQDISASPVQRGYIGELARNLRSKGTIPDEEEHDAEIIAEAAILGCGILLTSDWHMLDAQEHPRFREVLRDAHAEGSGIVVARPVVVAKRFDQQGRR